ncbi:uncharacterized protein UTRI_03163_B [Ustilago trichophora]|uniref:Copper-fist domain-containing protein n=1 Tax=Ustilago trichophora TaxID=86804 RepID=A0A5C3E5S3_9BASI|nr:uncharacterized protein UTRI_03163_B [Ustilago trichophora]
MTFTMSSPRSDEHSQLVPLRRSSQADASFEDKSTGVKYACASCIRGHRTSSCTHKDGSKGPLYPIRSKGRPPTQCEICRKKRKESGRHVRCDCTGKKAPPAAPSSQPLKRAPSTTSNAPILPYTADIASAHDRLDNARPAKKTKIQAEPKSTQLPMTSSVPRVSNPEPLDETLPQLPSFENVLAPIRPPGAHHSWSLPSIHSAHGTTNGSGTHNSQPQTVQELVPRRFSTLSLSSLMNPCGCRTTGSCTCCSEQRQRKGPVSPKQRDSNLDDCDSSRCSCSGPSCGQERSSPARENLPAPAQNNVAPTKVATSSCCSSKSASAASAPSIELLLQAVDMSTEFVPPACGCGEDCRCARCLAKQGLTSSNVNAQQRVAAHRASSAVTASSASPKTPPATMATQPTSAPVTDGPGCDDCAACDLALERPSGIGAVDSWMEKQRNASRASPPARPRSTSIESNTVSNLSTSRRTSQAEVAPISASVSISTSVPTLHGGLLTSESDNRASSASEDCNAEVRAELVLVHPKCAACLDVVKTKGVGVLSSVPVSTK